MSRASRFRTSLESQRRVIVALFFREIRTRVGQSRLGYIWVLSESVSHVAILSLIFTIAGRAPALGTSTAVFFFTGIGTFLYFRNIASQVQRAVSSNTALLNYPPVRPIDTIIARFAVEFATMVLSTLIVGLGLAMFGMDVVSENPAGVVMGVVLMALLGLGYGLFNAGIISVFENWSIMMKWLKRGLYFASGIFFVVDFLPSQARDILQWIPTVHAISIVREAHYPGFESRIADPIYPLVWALSLMAIGLLLERALRRFREE